MTIQTTSGIGLRFFHFSFYVSILWRPDSKPHTRIFHEKYNNVSGTHPPAPPLLHLIPRKQTQFTRPLIAPCCRTRTHGTCNGQNDLPPSVRRVHAHLGQREPPTQLSKVPAHGLLVWRGVQNAPWPPSPTVRVPPPSASSLLQTPSETAWLHGAWNAAVLWVRVQCTS